MIKAVLFDLDGTLTDSKEGIMNCLRYAFEKQGEPIPSEETLLMFLDVLMKNRVQTMLRRSRGKDANAACGQLKLRHAAKSE